MIRMLTLVVYYVRVARNVYVVVLRCVVFFVYFSYPEIET